METDTQCHKYRMINSLSDGGKKKKRKSSLAERIELYLNKQTENPVAGTRKT